MTVELIGQKGDTSFSLANEILVGENAKGQVTLTEPGYVDHSRLTPHAYSKPHATKLYRQIVEVYPDSPYANQAKTRLTELEKAR